MTHGGHGAPVRNPFVSTRPVMREVAERAGVATSSVSRVLSGHADVSRTMRNRVLDAVAALGYETDLLAQSMRTGETMTVGFVVGDISNPLLAQIALGAEVRLRLAGYSMLLTNSINQPDLDAAHLRILQQRRVDAVILSLSDESNSTLNKELAQLVIPSVLVDRHVAGKSFAAVLSDHASGISQAVGALAELGHRRIALVNGNPHVRPSRERATALRRACRGRSSVTPIVRAGAFTAQHGYRATMDLLGDHEPPTALIAGSNQILVGVLRGLRELKLSVPDAISLITCDDVALSEFLQPPITTISRDHEEMGRAAADLLLEQLNGEPPRTVVLPTRLQKTDSCARAPEQ